LLSDIDGAGSMEQVQQRIVKLLAAHGVA
jgi:hypothetical protein